MGHIDCTVLHSYQKSKLEEEHPHSSWTAESIALTPLKSRRFNSMIRTYTRLAAALVVAALASGSFATTRGGGWGMTTTASVYQGFSWALTSQEASGFDRPTPVEHRGALEREFRECRALRDDVMGRPALPGAPRFEERREMVLARSKAEPVVFTRVPQFTGELSPGMEARRRALLKTEHPQEVLQEAFKLFADFPEQRRQIMLRDGYLYTDDPRAARFLTMNVTLEDLFREDEIFLQRGSQTHRLIRGEQYHYVFADGPRKGHRARLLVFDRLWLRGDKLGPAVHLDVRDFAQRLGVDRMKIERITLDSVLAQLRFGSETVPAVLKHHNQKLRLSCLAVPPKDVTRVGRARDEAYRRAQVMHILRKEIVNQVWAGLPFDEPKTENGQQDGELRRRFETAYLSGRKSYRFNGDRYEVFAEKGHPLVPQVCIDFVTETLERASGMHWANEDETPKKYLGALDFDELLQGHRRQELALRTFARENPRWLDIYDVPQSDWVRYEKINQFYRFVSENKETFRPGDIMIIRGRAAWDFYHEIHTHTFFIYEADPVTGMPTLLAGNSGKPRIVTWDDEMLRAPKRSIRHRIRPNMDWLYDHVVLRTPLKEERWAAPLSAVSH